MMRIFTASFATETNTFSPVPTDRNDFVSAFYAPPGQHPETPTLCSSVMVALRKRARDDASLTIIEGTATWAEPGGLLNRQTYESLRDQILAELQAALPVDAVVLGMHGAMVAQGYDDCEGDFLERVRALAGPDVLIAAELDPHSHLTKKRVAQCNIMAYFLEFPHTDFYERGEHVADLALRTLRGEVKPVISTFDCKMIDIFPTSRQPMRGFIDRLKALQSGNILSISLIHGFMAGDVPEMGTQILVVTDNAKAEGDALAERLGREIISLRGTTAMPMLSIKDGLNAAYGAVGAKPVTVADVWDNPGGGTAGDGTLILHAILARGAKAGKVGLATIWDPIAVNFCHAAGKGATIMLRFGGKCDAKAGAPVDAMVEVTGVFDEGWQSFGQSRVTLGKSATVRLCDTEIDIILNTNRTQVFEPDIFVNCGIDPLKKDVLVVKSTNHFHAGFAKISDTIIYIDAGAPYPSNPRVTDYKKVRRNLWPRMDDPWTAAVIS